MTHTHARDLMDEPKSLVPAMQKTVATARSRLQGKLTPLGAGHDFQRLVGSASHSPFQSALWLSTWFETLGQARKVEGFWLEITADDAGVLLAMPLVRRSEGGLSILEMPDCGVTDYAAPLLPCPAALDKHHPAEIWHAILTALPEADLLRLERSPARIGTAANPLIAHGLALPSRISGWQKPMPQNWEEYLASLSPRMREKIGKCRRRFGRAEASQIGRLDSVSKALEWLPRLTQWQAERMGEKGRDYELDDPAIAAFYTRLVERGLETGDVVMMALEAEGELVALNYGYRDQGTLVYLRVGNTFGKWSPVAPGILATKAILKDALATGVETFDFGAGDYEYKWKFGGERLPLFDIEIPLSLRGWPGVLKRQARRRLAQNRALKSLVEKWRARRSNAGSTKSSDGE